MKKKLLTMSSASIIMIMLTTSFAFANEGPIKNEYEINSLPKLEQVVENAQKDGELTSKEKKAIISETNPEVIGHYSEQLTQDVLEATNEIVLEEKIHFDGKDAVTSNKTKSIEKKIIVDKKTGETADVKIKSTPETPSVAKVSASTSERLENVTKNFGGRAYTYTIHYYSGLVSILATVTNHYTITKNGLQERYAAVDLKGMPTCHNDLQAQFMDPEKCGTGKGKSVGIKSQIRASVIGAYGIALSHKTYYAKARVKVVSFGKKSATVQQGLYWTGA